MKIVIVGGVAGGAAAATRLRRIDENAEIIMIEKGEFISFANCGLPYYLGGVISDRQKLLVQTVEGMRDRFMIIVRTQTEALKINKEAKTVLMKDLKTGREYYESYDFLVLSPGTESITPPILGVSSERIFTLKTIPDIDKIMSYAEDTKPQRAVVIGGGTTGIETAENLILKGIKTAIVEATDQVLGSLDYEMASIIHSHLKEKNVELYLNDGVSAFEDNEEFTTVCLRSGKRLKADMIILSIGVRPNIALAKSAGLEIGECGGIKVNDYLQTSDKNIYAVGDAVELKHSITQKQVLVQLAGPANRQAEVAADNIVFGNKKKYNGVLGTAIVKVFDFAAASTGLNEKTLKMEGIEYLSSLIHCNNHVSYYPGATLVTIKLLFSKDGTILGAQSVGAKGVEKTIDILATAIKSKMKVDGLEELELAYAPQFGSAKDPVNIAGYVSNNILKGDVVPAYWQDIENLNLENTILLDVRTHAEYELGTIKNAINIPIDSLRENMDKLDKNKTIIIFCKLGIRSYIGYRILSQNGYKAKNLLGGYKTYSSVQVNDE